MIASVRGQRPAHRARPGGRRGRAASACSCTPHPARPRRCGAARRPLCRTTLVVREDSLTLYGFANDRRARHVRAGADRLGRRAPTGPGHALRHASRPDPGGDQRVGHRGADQGARHRQEGRRAHGARAAGQDRLPPAAAGAAAAARPSGGPGLARAGHRGPRRPRLVGQAGRGRRRARGRRGRRPSPTSPRCSAPPCASWGGRRWPDGFASEMYEDSSLDATARIIDAGGDADDRTVEAALRPRRLSEVSGQTRVCDQLGLVLEAAKRRGTRSRPRPALRAARAGEDHPGDDRRRRAREARSASPAARRSSTRATSRRCSPRSWRGRCSSSTRSTGCPARRRRCSTSPWRTSGSTSSSARVPAPPPSRSSCRPSPSWAPPPGPGCCPRRCATASASPATSTSTPPRTS